MKLALTGGGTLGHVLPALRIYEEMLEKGCITDAFYIGSKKERERNAVISEGLRFYAISTGKLRRYFSLRNFTDIFKICAGFLSSLRIMIKEKPDVLFSKGGYVSVPVVLASHLLGVRTVIHESDFSMGLANRIASRFADHVCLGFDSPLSDGKKFVFTGNPVRKDIQLAEKENTEKDSRLILVIGGSQGAEEINSLVYSNLEALCSRYEIVHQCGAHGDFSLRHENYSQHEFLGPELAMLMKRAQVVVSRAGANSLNEICCLSKASLLVPLRTASRGDQVENARFMESRGAACVLHEGEDFVEKIAHLMDDEEVNSRMGRCAHEQYIPDAAARISCLVNGE